MQKIPFSLLELKILDPKILIEDPEQFSLFIDLFCITFLPKKLQFISQPVEKLLKSKTVYLSNLFYHFTTLLAFELF